MGADSVQQLTRDAVFYSTACLRRSGSPSGVGALQAWLRHHRTVPLVA